MLVIRKSQVDAFHEASLAEFEREMIAHSQAFSPRLCEILGPEQVSLAVRQAMGRAACYGFTFRGPIRLYIELMFLCGSDFDTDPQYAAIAEELKSTSDQMVRADRIWQGVVDYNRRVCGVNNINVLNAERYLAQFARSSISFVESNFDEMIERELEIAFPQKVAFVGRENILKLIQEGRAEAQKNSFNGLRAQALIVVLKFSFGHGCMRDPLYPWISRTLHDEHIKDADARAKRLEKKARTWLEHVLARYNAGDSK